MGISCVLCKKPPLEVTVDTDFDSINNRLDISLYMGSGFRGKEPGVDLSIPLTIGEFNTIVERLKEQQEAINNPVSYRVEYDVKFTGGDYHDVGEFAYIPAYMLDNLTIPEAFVIVTGLNRKHIIHYTYDETYVRKNGSWQQICN